MDPAQQTHDATTCKDAITKPKETFIESSGSYEISCEPEGVSRIHFFKDFIDIEDCDSIQEQLLKEMPWKQRDDVKYGMEPRLTAWYGDLPYSYAGVTLEPYKEWSPLLSRLKSRIEETAGSVFNSVLANLYRDGEDHVPWHSDDEPSLRQNPTIASLSFGETRMFELRKKPPSGEAYSNSEIVRMPLNSGSLLIMEGRMQEDWQHRITKEDHNTGSRINLTFRVIYPEP